MAEDTQTTEPKKFFQIVNEFFKAHGIKSPAPYLSKRGGYSDRAHFYVICRMAENGIGPRRDNKKDPTTKKYIDSKLDPKAAAWLIQEAELLIEGDEVFEPTPIEKYLRPKLEAFWASLQEKPKNDTGPEPDRDCEAGSDSGTGDDTAGGD